MELPKDLARNVSPQLGECGTQLWVLNRCVHLRGAHVRMVQRFGYGLQPHAIGSLTRGMSMAKDVRMQSPGPAKLYSPRLKKGLDRTNADWLPVVSSEDRVRIGSACGDAKPTKYRQRLDVDEDIEHVPPLQQSISQHQTVAINLPPSEPRYLRHPQRSLPEDQHQPEVATPVAAWPSLNMLQKLSNLRRS